MYHLDSLQINDNIEKMRKIFIWMFRSPIIVQYCDQVKCDLIYFLTIDLILDILPLFSQKILWS